MSDSATALIGTVHATWAALPAATRPRLLLFGESLGSFGTENAFAGTGAMTSGADGTRSSGGARS